MKKSKNIGFVSALLVNGIMNLFISAVCFYPAYSHKIISSGHAVGYYSSAGVANACHLAQKQ